MTMPKFKVKIDYEDMERQKSRTVTVTAKSEKQAQNIVDRNERRNYPIRAFVVRKPKLVESNLKNFLDDLLKEDNPAPPPENTQEVAPVEPPKDVSLDQVVDRYLIRYEKESIPTVDDYEDELYGESSSELDTSVVLKDALNEAEEDELDLGGDEEADPAPEEDLGGEEDAGLDLGGDEPAPEAGDESTSDVEAAPAVTATPQINLQDFARSVARLVNNYEELLNPRDTILNRVEAYIQSNYDDRTAEELMELLDTNYSLRNQDEEEENQEEYPTPYSVGALSSG
jgi:hypothetical protein